MNDITNRYRRKYDIFNDGVGVRVLNTETGKRGIVVDIKETSFEYIEPFVKYEDADQPIKEMTWNLLVIENA